MKNYIVNFCAVFDFWPHMQNDVICCMPNKVVLSIKTQSQTFKCILAFISRCCIDNEITLKRVKYRLPQLPDEMIDTFL